MTSCDPCNLSHLVRDDSIIVVLICLKNRIYTLFTKVKSCSLKVM